MNNTRNIKRVVKIKISMYVHTIVAEMPQESTSVFTVLAKLWSVLRIAMLKLDQIFFSKLCLVIL